MDHEPFQDFFLSIDTLTKERSTKRMLIPDSALTFEVPMVLRETRENDGYGTTNTPTLTLTLGTEYMRDPNTPGSNTVASLILSESRSNIVSSPPLGTKFRVLIIQEASLPVTYPNEVTR